MNIPELPLWQRAVEGQMLALKTLQAYPKDDIAATNYINAQCIALSNSSTFGWGTIPTNAVMTAASSIPNDTQLNRWNLSTNAFWWWFDNPIEAPYESCDGLVRAISGVYLDPFFYIFSWYKTSDTRLVPAHNFEWRKDATINDVLEASKQTFDVSHPDYSEQRFTREKYAVELFSKFLLAALAWLDQKILVTDTPHIERHRRKEYERKTGHVPLVKVVLLRKYERPDRTYADSDRAGYSHRFIVGGHWRNQACGPNWNDTRLKFIMPYIKGPEDKPLISKITVNEVVR